MQQFVEVEPVWELETEAKVLVPKSVVGLGMVAFEVAPVAEKCCSFQL